MHENNLKQESALDFILGGNALFTVLSVNSGKRYTFKVLHDCKNDRIFKVGVLNGTDNKKNYKQIGDILKGNDALSHLFEPLRTVHPHPSTVAFEYIFYNLCLGKFMPTLEIWHEGRCCRCGRVLTVPESISMGIGPECAFL